MTDLNIISAKLHASCEALGNLISSVRPFYLNENTSKDLETLYWTIIGAAIWYLPSSMKLYILINSLFH